MSRKPPRRENIPSFFCLIPFLKISLFYFSEGINTSLRKSCGLGLKTTFTWSPSRFGLGLVLVVMVLWGFQIPGRFWSLLLRRQQIRRICLKKKHIKIYFKMHIFLIGALPANTLLSHLLMTDSSQTAT